MELYSLSSLFPTVTSVIGTLRNHDGNSNESVAQKCMFVLLQLLRDYSNSFNLYNVAELSSNRTGENGVQVETENEKDCPHLLTFSTKP